MKLQGWLLAGIAAVASLSSPAQAVVFTSADTFTTEFNNSPVTVSRFSEQTFPLLFGLVSVRLDIGFIVADGARNGASLGIGSTPGGLVTAELRRRFQSSTVVLQGGAAQAFAGAGGTPGQVFIATEEITNLAGSEITVSRFKAQGPVSGADRTLHVAGAGVVADGSVGDGAALGLGSDPTLITATLSPPGSVGTGAAVGPTPSLDGFASSSGIAGLGCDLTTCTLETRFKYKLGSSDSLALLARTEVGREAPPGDVIWFYRPAALTGVFDCGTDGCDFLRVTTSYELSPRDAAGYVVRFEVVPLTDVPVPAPASLVLLAAGLSGLGVLGRHPTCGERC